MICCEFIEDLGCISSCDVIETGVNAAATGVYTIVLMPDLIQIVSATITSGQPIYFSGGYLNEDGRTVFKVLKPDGTYLTSGVNDCFQVDIRPNSTPTLVEVDIDCVYDVYINSVFSQQVTLTDCADLTINLT